MIHRGTYDGTIYYNPANKFCIISVKTAEKDVPEEARSIRRRKDHLIRFVATGYELPRTDAVELELDGEWKKGKYGMQLQVEQWHEIVPQTKSGVEGYLASGLIKGIGPALAKQIVSRFGVETLDILQNRPERLLEIKGITENKLEAIKTSYAESRMLQDLMTLLSPFKITPKTAQKIYQFFGPASVDILKKSPFELCQISGFGFLRVDAIVQKNGGDLRAPMRIKGALFWALEDSKGKNGHLFLTSEALQKEALQLLNAKIPIPSLRLHAQEVSDVLEDMILHGEVVSVNTKLYYGQDFVFMASNNQAEAAERIVARYCREIEESGIDRVQILSPFRSDGAASAEQLNEAIREVVNPFRSAEEEIKIGVKVFRVNDRIMQTKNTAKVSNGDLGFIRYIKNDEDGTRVGLDFGVGRELEYGIEDMVNLDLAYATTIHKAMGSEYDTVIMPLLKAHTVMLYRNLLYTGITRAKKRVVLIGQKQVLFMAIHRNEIGKRNTLLGERIHLYYKAYARRAGIPVPADLEKELKHAG